MFPKNYDGRIARQMALMNPDNSILHWFLSGIGGQIVEKLREGIVSRRVREIEKKKKDSEEISRTRQSSDSEEQKRFLTKLRNISQPQERAANVLTGRLAERVRRRFGANQGWFMRKPGCPLILSMACEKIPRRYSDLKCGSLRWKSHSEFQREGLVFAARSMPRRQRSKKKKSFGWNNNSKSCYPSGKRVESTSTKWRQELRSSPSNEDDTKRERKSMKLFGKERWRKRSKPCERVWTLEVQSRQKTRSREEKERDLALIGKMSDEGMSGLVKQKEERDCVSHLNTVDGDKKKALVHRVYSRLV